MTAEASDPRNREALVQRGLHLEYLSLGWNAIAGTGAVVAGLSTASVALLGFGLDVAIDSLASGLLVWRFLKEARGDAAKRPGGVCSHFWQEPLRLALHLSWWSMRPSNLRTLAADPLSERVEAQATRGVGVALLAAGLYIAAQAVHSLLAQTTAGASAVGVAIAILSVCLLPPLGYAKIRLAARLGSAALRGDGILTTVGAVLAAVTLLGLVVNTRLGWWWADPLAALLMTGVLLREGWRSLRHSRSA